MHYGKFLLQTVPLAKPACSTEAPGPHQAGERLLGDALLQQLQRRGGRGGQHRQPEAEQQRRKGAHLAKIANVSTIGRTTLPNNFQVLEYDLMN